MIDKCTKDYSFNLFRSKIFHRNKYIIWSRDSAQLWTQRAIQGKWERSQSSNQENVDIKRAMNMESIFWELYLPSNRSLISVQPRIAVGEVDLHESLEPIYDWSYWDLQVDKWNKVKIRKRNVNFESQSQIHLLQHLKKKSVLSKLKLLYDMLYLFYSHLFFSQKVPKGKLAISLSVSMCTCVYAYMCVCMYYACICVYMYVYVLTF